MATFRIEKTKDFTVMSNYHLRDKRLSLKAKGLMSLMLSLPEDWNYTTAGLSAICKDGRDSIRATVNELEEAGYLVRTRLRNANGQLANIEYTVYEQPRENTEKHDLPQTENPHVVNDNSVDTTQKNRIDKPFSPMTENPSQVKPQTEKPVPENPTLVKPTQVKPTLEKPTQLNTNISNTNKLNTNQSINHMIDDDETDAQYYRKVVKENIDYDVIICQYDKDSLNEIVELIVETLVACKEPRVHIAGRSLESRLVQERLLSINSAHIEYVFDCLNQTTKKIKNIKSYLLTALFNAPVTISNYYNAEVNHDLYSE